MMGKRKTKSVGAFLRHTLIYISILIISSYMLHCLLSYLMTCLLTCLLYRFRGGIHEKMPNFTARQISSNLRKFLVQKITY